jgi:hypothetical protein
MISGVSAGLGHYFGIDAVWVRILFILLVWGAGTGPCLYYPMDCCSCCSNNLRLEMTGEPVNISNIEKKVREEFENVSDKFKMLITINTGTKAGKIGNTFGDFIMTIFKIFAKFLGII